MTMRSLRAMGCKILVVLAVWLLAAPLGNGQRITNFINQGTARDATAAGTRTFLRVRSTGNPTAPNNDNANLAYPATINALRAMVGNPAMYTPVEEGWGQLNYRQLVNAPETGHEYLYIPYMLASQSAGTYTPAVEEGIFLQKNDVYFVGARRGDEFFTFGSEANEINLRNALMAMQAANALNPGWTLTRRSAISTDYLRASGSLEAVKIRTECLKLAFQNIFSYLQGGDVNQKTAQASFYTIAVAVSEAMRLPAVEERIVEGLEIPPSQGSTDFRLGLVPLAINVEGRSTVASTVPKQWDTLSKAVRASQNPPGSEDHKETLTLTNVYDGTGAAVESITTYDNIKILNVIGST